MKHALLFGFTQNSGASNRRRAAVRDSLSLRVIPHRAGALFVILLTIATPLFATTPSGPASIEHARELRERARASDRLDSERVRHGQPADASAVFPAPGDDGHWAHVGISSLGGHVAIYDPKRDRMILFGGDDDGTPRYDTWSLSMTDSHPWSKLTPSGDTPPEPAFQTAVYDPVRDRMLMLGGGWPNSATLNDLWALNLSGAPAWTRIYTAGGSPSMFGPAVYDPVRDRLILTDGTGSIWTLSLSGTPTWSLIATAGTPPGQRYYPAIVYDSARDRLLFWGGDTDVTYLPADLWALSLSGTPTWTPVPSTGAAPAYGRFAATALYDPVNDRVIIYGGSDYHNRWEGWTVSLSGTPTWTELDLSAPYPAGRSFHTGVYDTLRQRMVIFSGYQFNHGSPDRNDVWALSLKGALVWSTVRGTSPEPRSFHSAVYDPDADRMLVFGGYSWNAVVGDVSSELWELTLDARPTWNLLSPTGEGPRSSDPITLYDDQKHRLIVFAGGVWACTFRGTPKWTRLEPDGSGPGEIHSAVIDTRRHRVVALATPDNAPWELSLSERPRWRKIDAAASETIPGGDVAVYDRKRDRLIIWGETQSNVLWTLSLSGHPSWNKITLFSGFPTWRRGYTLVLDEKRDRIILHAGRLTYYDDYWTWSFSLSGTPHWQGLDSTFDGYIILDDGHSAIYDPVRDRMIVFGGRYFYNMFDETWALQFGTPPASNATVAGVSMGLQPAYPNPFNPTVTIPFALAREGMVTLAIYDVAGRLVRTLVDGWTQRGSHVKTWDGISDRGERVASGVYFYRLQAPGVSDTRKLVMMK